MDKETEIERDLIAYRYESVERAMDKKTTWIENTTEDEETTQMKNITKDKDEAPVWIENETMTVENFKTVVDIENSTKYYIEQNCRYNKC